MDAASNVAKAPCLVLRRGSRGAKLGPAFPSMRIVVRSGQRDGGGILVTLARLAALCALLALPQTAGAGEPAPDSWGQLWGPTGNGMAAPSARLAPTVRLREVWRRPVGSGFSALSLNGTRGFTGISDGP